MHVDFSKAIAAAGITVTMIQFGDHKSDGNEYTKLEKQTLARFQADVDQMGTLFVDTVARNRGLSAKDVRDTQALTYLGQAGVNVGFADAVMAPDEAFRALRAQLG
jgi:ClpP class serine protease